MAVAISFAGGAAPALAANCPIVGGTVTVSATSCAIPPGDTVNRITASTNSAVVANGVHVPVPFGVGVTSQSGSLTTFGVDPSAGGSSILSQFGGGGITVLLANGTSSRIDASDLNVTFGGGGNIMVEAQAGGQITLDDGTVVNILNSGGNQGLLATGTNSRIIANNITETATVGGGDFGVHAQSGGEIDLTSSVFNFNGTGGGETVVVAESQSTIVAQNTTFTATGGGGGDVAIKVDTGSNVSLTGGSVTMTSVGGGEIAVLVQSAGSTLTATDVPIILSGAGGDTAVKAANGGTITLTGGSDSVISTAGGEKGIWATGGGSEIAANGVAISVPSSGGAFGVLADSAGTIMLGAGSTVSTGGDGSIGISATGSGSSVTAMDGVTVATSGANATGVDASVGGTVSLTGGAVTTSGSGAAGLSASAATIAASGVTIATTGLFAPGGILQNGSAMTIGGGSVTTSGAGSYGFLFQGAGGIANALQISNATVNSAAGAFRVEGAVANINLSNAIVAGADGILMSADGTATASLTATASSQLTGAIATAAGGVSNVTLQDNTIWNMTGSSNVTNLVNGDPSSIIFSAPVGDPTQLASYKTLTAVNYAGMGGGIVLNTYLGGDGSPSDRVIINGGAATGATSLTIHNNFGPGAETVANGIPVVQAIDGATTTPGAFALANGELRAGAFDYDLFRGGVNPGNSANDWFLRSSFVSPPIPPIPPVPPIPPEPPIIPPIPPPPLPPTPPPNPLPPNVVFPIIGPELATYGVVQPLARQLGLSILGTLDDRLGDTYEPDGCAAASASAPAALPTKKPGPAPAPCPLFSPSVWGRFFGQTLTNRYSAFADPRASGNLGGFEGGIDLLRGSLIAGHSERAGVYGAYGNVNSDVTGLVTNPAATAYILTHTGSMSLNAGSAGGYWTHVGPGGWYVDTVLQGTWYGGSASTQFATLNTDGTGFIASLDGGAPFALPQLGPGFVLEPQGQILWQKVSFRHDNDGLGDVALGDTTGPSGRVGLKTKWTIVTGGGQVWQPYLKADLWRDWGAEANAVYSGTDVVPLLTQATMLQLGGGLTGRINANVSLFANVDYEFAVGDSQGDKRNGVRGALGARYRW